MSFLTQAYLLDRFGLRLTVEQLSEALGMPIGTVYNQLSKGALGIPTYIDAKRRWADYRDVADYLDRRRSDAVIPGEAACSA